MLDAPRELVAWALPLLDAPANALVLFDALLLGTCRLPILFPPVPPRFALISLGLAPEFEVDARLATDPFRFVAVGCRMLPAACCCREFACLVAMESPRAVPPYFVAVALLE